MYNELPHVTCLMVSPPQWREVVAYLKETFGDEGERWEEITNTNGATPVKVVRFLKERDKMLFDLRWWDEYDLAQEADTARRRHFDRLREETFNLQERFGK